MADNNSAVVMNPLQIYSMIQSIEAARMTPTDDGEMDAFESAISKVEDAMLNDIPYVRMEVDETKVIMSRISEIERNHLPSQWFKAIRAAQNIKQAPRRGWWNGISLN